MADLLPVPHDFFWPPDVRCASGSSYRFALIGSERPEDTYPSPDAPGFFGVRQAMTALRGMSADLQRSLVLYHSVDQHMKPLSSRSGDRFLAARISERLEDLGIGVVARYLAAPDDSVDEEIEFATPHGKALPVGVQLGCTAMIVVSHELDAFGEIVASTHGSQFYSAVTEEMISELAGVLGACLARDNSAAG